MSEIKIPQHVAARIERRWAEKIERELASRCSMQTMDIVHDRKARAVPVIRRRSIAARH